MKRKRILIVCLGNTCRSFIYHSLLKSINADLEVYSAGIEVSKEKVQSQAKKILEHHNIIAAKEKPNKIKDYEDLGFDIIIMLDDKIKKKDMPNSKKYYKINIKDPDDSKISKGLGIPTYENYEKTFLVIKDDIEKMIKNLLLLE